MKSLRTVSCMLCLIAFISFTLVGCKKEGTAEKAGKKLDQTLDSAKKKVDEATK